MLTVVNTHHVSHFKRDTLYIGREYMLHTDTSTLAFNTYIFANPYKLGVDGDRKTVLIKYKHWIVRKLIKSYDTYLKTGKESKEMMEMLRLVYYYESNNEYFLRCYCYPKPCHGDILISLVRKLIGFGNYDKFIEYLKEKVSLSKQLKSGTIKK